MANFSINFTTPAGKDAELVAALNRVWKAPGDPDMTPAELVQNFKMRCEALLRNAYTDGKKRLAAEQADTTIDIT